MDIKKKLYIVFNFMDLLLPIQNITTSGVSQLKVNGFTVFLKLFNIGSSYLLAFGVIKIVQLFIYLLLTSPRVFEIYYLFELPFVCLLELGASRLVFTKIRHFLFFILRLGIKSLVLVLLNEIFMLVF